MPGVQAIENSGVLVDVKNVIIMSDVGIMDDESPCDMPGIGVVEAMLDMELIDMLIPPSADVAIGIALDMLIPVVCAFFKCCSACVPSLNL